MARTREVVDTTFDFRSDTPSGKDPDTSSPTLRRYHRLLWSKPLPGGVVFQLDDTTPHEYLHHRSDKGEFFLSSDAVIPSFARERRLGHIIARIPKEELDHFNAIGYTMGGIMLFPSNKVAGRMTINGARGFHPSIKDRFDLTVECIRRHFRNEGSPLAATLNRYADFFGLFEHFRGYIEFFLLQDLVGDDFSCVNFFLPFDDFKTSPLPASKEEYVAHMQLSMGFIQARNRRIRDSR